MNHITSSVSFSINLMKYNVIIEFINMLKMEMEGLQRTESFNTFFPGLGNALVMMFEVVIDMVTDLSTD